MDCLQFVASIVNSLVWPVATVTMLLIFREPVGQLLGRIKSMSFGKAKAEFIDELEKAESAADVVLEQNTIKTEEITGEDRILNLAMISPEAAILESYKELEAVLIALRDELQLTRHVGRRENVKQMHSMGLVDSNTVELFIALRKAQKAAAHAGSSITIGEALQFRNQAKLLTKQFKQILQRNKEKPQPG